MHITYENEIGRIDFTSKVWRLKAIEGLGLCAKREVLVTYPETDGSELLSLTSDTREIFLSGDIILEKRDNREISRAIRVLNKSGVFKICSGGKRRKIRARCISFTVKQSDKKAVFQPFVLQLTADCPYFEDFEPKRLSLFKRNDLISTEFTLPCVFTERISRIKAINAGDVPCMMKLHVLCKKNAYAGIELINHTTEKNFRLDYHLSDGEEIIIDFENRKIENADGADLISYMNSDSFLSELYLAEGINDIEMLSLGEGSDMIAWCEFSPKYIEAVI